MDGILSSGRTIKRTDKRDNEAPIVNERTADGARKADGTTKLRAPAHTSAVKSFYTTIAVIPSLYEQPAKHEC